MDKAKHDLKEKQEVRVIQKIVESGRSRNVPFTGIVKKVRGQGVNKTITLRQVLEGVEVDRIFAIDSPTIIEISIISAKEKITKRVKKARKRQTK